MSKEITKIFNESNVRIFTVNDNPYFSVLDVCNVLNISNSRMATSRLDSDDVTITDVIDSMGRNQKLTIINEGALYQLIFRSRTKNAKEFRKWVTHEVIPSIRKTGKYSIPQSLKKLSTQNRKVLTDTWRECGIEKKHHFIQLTLQEYKALGIDKKKKDMDKSEILLLSAMESMEALKLFHDPKDNYYDCRDSLKETAKQLPVKPILGLEEK
ncbi:MAG: Bro-N domain-containing protein [Colwellia sp.]|nr:Bro-N domain-containing protein [Colwellia sp.]